MSDPVTIALHTARQRRDEGGALSPVDMPHVRTPKFHNGAIHSGVAGRTDHLPITVESGSYVVPADIVSAGGSGNTLAGFKVLRRTFGGEPYGAGSGPYGQNKGVYGLPVQYAAGGAVTPDLATLDGPQKSDPGYLYHATNHERASDIASNGLKTHRPSQFTDQSTWPDGSKEKRNYFARAENAWQFAPEEGKPALLRVPMAAHPFKRESTGDFYSTVPVPPSKIDYLAADKSWNPLHRLRGARASGGRTRAAGILFLSPEKEVLLMRRTENDGDQGKWAFPAGGIKKDETPEEAARRETREESGYEHEGGLSPFMHSDAQNVDFTTYLAHSQKFDPKLNHEHDGAKWVTLDEAAKLPLHPGVKAALEKLATRAGKAHGGESSGVPIVAAGGEWVISPSHVRQVGGGDIDLGHRVLDSFVHRVRKELIGTLAKLPGPRRD